LQIRVAAGEPFPFHWQEIHPRGHAIECRIYAEDPDNNFFPSPGKILSRRAPSGPGVRLDEGVYSGWTVPVDYDPLLGKLIVWAADRGSAIARMHRALDEYHVSGIKTNVGLFRRILAEPDFINGKVHTRWLDEWLTQQRPREGVGPGMQDAALAAAVAWHLDRNPASATSVSPANARVLRHRRELDDRFPER